MNYSDFRYMRRGEQLLDLKKDEATMLTSVHQKGTKKDRALLLLHGFTSTPAVYRCLIPQLKNYDALVCPALAGHAESIEAFATSTGTDWLLSAQKACEKLCADYQKVDVLGLSLGALLACKLSATFQFNHLFLLAPALKLKQNIVLNKAFLVFLKKLGFKELRGLGGNLMTNKHAEISYRKLPIAPVIELFTLIQEHQLSPPPCPTDIFLGKHDLVVASNEIETMFLDAPNIKIHWLENSAHVLPLDNDLDEIAQCINQCG